GLEITRFDAVRDGHWIYIVGKIENVSPSDIYFTSRISNSGILIQGKPDTLIQSKQAAYVRAQVPVTNNAMTLKLEVTGAPNDSAVKEFRLASKKTVFVVRYTTSGNWVIAPSWIHDLSDGFDASQVARSELQPLGFETRIKKTTTRNVDVLGSNTS